MTIHLIGDLHAGATDPNNARDAKALADMTGSLMLPPVVAHVTTGDFIDTYTSANDTAALAWLNTLTSAPRYVVVGNHDMVGRTGGGDAAAAAYGMPAKNYAVNLGAITLIVVSPSADQTDHTTILLDAATLAWLDATLAAAVGPCAIACHAPLAGTVAATTGNVDGYDSSVDPWHPEPQASIEAILAARPNAIAWLSGHVHAHPRNTGAVVSKTFGGHAVACVAAGALLGTGSGTRPDDPLMTAYVTFYPHRVDVRYRDHGGVTWFRTPVGALVRSITI